MLELTATYSPEDNKLRLYASARLDAELYARVKEAGFIWAPKQGLFVAPMWTPARADLLLELCGEIGDEDTSLSERAEERAERFEGYQDSRAKDAEGAHAAVRRITEGIPLGQPILIGHHSEPQARRAAKKIEAGMRRAVDMWETSEYWKRRARGAVSSAKYKELPAVRYRRIKGLEADKRKHARTAEDSEFFLKLWNRDGLTDVQALAIASRDPAGLARCFPLADYPREAPASQYEGPMSIYSALADGVITTAQGIAIAQDGHNRLIARAYRWLAHLNNRITYEREMLGEQGGLKAEGLDIQAGGKVLLVGGNEWLTVLRVTKRDGQVISVTTAGRYRRQSGIEQIAEYKAPTAEESASVKKATKLAPLCNFPGDGFITMTSAEWTAKHPDYRLVRKQNATAERGAFRARQAVIPGSGYKLAQVYISDLKRVDPPKPEQAEPAKVDSELISPALAARSAPEQVFSAPADDQAAQFLAIKEALRHGVQVATAPQLFPTPVELARRMVALADIRPGDDVLEPHGGTGRILHAIRENAPADISLTTVEIQHQLCASLSRSQAADAVHCADFLAWKPADGRRFSRILMNPPFERGQDIEHIKHALTLLDAGGSLVAICANGPRQNDALRPLVEERGGLWEVLPAGTFRESGTGVNTVLLKLAA